MEVERRALPTDHCFSAAICSAINRDNGTKLFIDAATSSSVGSSLSSKAANIASKNTASISAPDNLLRAKKLAPRFLLAQHPSLPRR